MTNFPPNTPIGSFNRVPLATLIGVVAITCIFLGITRPSFAASILLIVAMLFAIGSIFMRRIRGEIVVLLLIFGIPLLFLAIQYTFGVYLSL